MSSENACEKQACRKSKVSWGRLIRPGLVEPKPRPYGVGDGQPVNIPAPLRSVDQWGDAARVASGPLVVAGQAGRGPNRQIRSAVP